MPLLTLSKLVEAVKTSLCISVNHMKEIMKLPRKQKKKSMKMFLIVLAMIACLGVSTSQLWVANYDQLEKQSDVPNIDKDIRGHVESGEGLILLSMAITFLGCILLLLLMQVETWLRLFLFTCLAFGVGAFLVLVAVSDIKTALSMGSSDSKNYTCCTSLIFIKQVRLVVLPLLSSIFLALSYCNMANEGAKHQETTPSLLKLPNILPYTSTGPLVLLPTNFSDKLSTFHSSIYMYITLVITSATSLVTMVFSNHIMVSTMQSYYLQLQQNGNRHGMKIYQDIQNELAQFSTCRFSCSKVKCSYS